MRYVFAALWKGAAVSTLAIAVYRVAHRNLKIAQPGKAKGPHPLKDAGPELLARGPQAPACGGAA